MPPLKVANERKSFAVRARVRATTRFTPAAKAAGVYKVVRHLPDQGDGRQYRIKGETDLHERVVTEGQLVPS